MKKTKKIKKTTTCLDCQDHEVIHDRDPDDWFCDDDAAVICKKTLNTHRDKNSKWISNRNKYQTVTCSCRPYNIKKESKIPKWCPKEKKKCID